MKLTSESTGLSESVGSGAGTPARAEGASNSRARWISGSMFTALVEPICVHKHDKKF